MGFLNVLGKISGKVAGMSNPLGQISTAFSVIKGFRDIIGKRKQAKDFIAKGEASQAEAQNAWNRGELRGSMGMVADQLSESIMRNQGAGLSGRFADNNLDRADQNAIQVGKYGTNANSIASSLAQAVALQGQNERARMMELQLSESQKNAEMARMARQDYNSQANMIVDDNQRWYEDKRDQGKADVRDGGIMLDRANDEMTKLYANVGNWLGGGEGGRGNKKFSAWLTERARKWGANG